MSFTIATTVDEALAAMAAGATPIAGGTDLVVGARHGKAPLPDDLVAIDRIDAMTAIDQTADGTSVGALVSHARLMTDPVIVGSYTAVADASALVGSPATRHVGTLGGNVMNASPAMDTGAPLLVLGAEADLRSSSATRRITLDELWTGPGQTSAADDELLAGLHLPAPAERCGSAYVRLEYRRAMEIAVVGAAAGITLADDGTIASAAVALAAVAPTIVAVEGASDALAGLSPADAGATIAAMASEQASPISDLRASDAYRRHCIGVMAKRAVDAAARRAVGESIAVPVKPFDRNRSRLMSQNQNYDLEVNGVSYPVAADQSKNLLSVIREDVGLTGTKEGCDDCECGACMVLIDGQPVNSCSYLAVQAQGRSVTTIEGVMQGPEMHALQRNLLEEGGVQCGFCTPGMIMSAHALLDREANPDLDAVRIGLSGNLCRCTGYAKILAAVERTAAELDG